MVVISKGAIFNAPRELVYRAFTDPDQFAQWFGRAGCSIARDSIKSDARVGEHLRFVMTGPGMRSPVDMVFTEVEASGVPGVAGSLLVHLRLEFHDERNGKTTCHTQGAHGVATVTHGQVGADNQERRSRRSAPRLSARTSKLIMRVRFPSSAPAYCHFSLLFPVIAPSFARFVPDRDWMHTSPACGAPR
jgi:hypothetical protein